MNKYEPKGSWDRGSHRATEYNQHVSHQSSTIKDVDLHLEESWSGTRNCGQAGEWATSALEEGLVFYSYFKLWCGRILTEISTSASENEAGYLMWELKGAAVGIT